MSKEVPLQIGLFDGELTDTRTRRQKKAAREAAGYRQAQMFSQREVAQFGVRARPKMPAIGRNGKPLRMVLEMEDPRTEEEKELDRQREADALTGSLFPESATPKEEPSQTSDGTTFDTQPGDSIIDVDTDAMEVSDGTTANASGL